MLRDLSFAEVLSHSIILMQGDVTVKNVQDDLNGIIKTGRYSVKQVSDRVFELTLVFRTETGNRVS